MTILAIENSSDSSIRTALEQGGYTDIVFCGSFEEATVFLQLDQTAAGAPRIDLIFLASMSDGEGMALCRRIKTDCRYCQVPIIMLVPPRGEQQRVQALAAGAHTVLAPNADKDVLAAVVETALKCKQETDRIKLREQDLLKTVSQLEADNRRMYRLSHMDALTGVPNRRNYDATLVKEWRRARREETPLSLLMIDIDYFKAYNDTYGHQAGDECLCRIANLVRQVLRRPADFLARYGGEEFAVILPDTGAEGACCVAEEIRTMVLDSRIVHGAAGATPYVTVSIGAATVRPESGLCRLQLMAEADDAMYRAKEKGGNQTVAVQLPPLQVGNG